MSHRSRVSQRPTRHLVPAPVLSRLADLPPDARVTVVRTGGLGDTILVLPTLAILRAADPAATLTLVGSAWAEALRPLMALPAHILHVDHAFPAAHRGRLEGERESSPVAASHAIIVYTATPESDFVAHVRRVCPGSVLVWPLTPPEGIHAARHLANVIASVSSDPDAVPAPTLRCLPELRLQGRQWLDRQFGRGVCPVAIQPGAGGKRKCWPAHRFVEIATLLDAPLLLIEGPADADACREVTEHFAPSAPVVRAAGLSLPHLAALLVECRGYVGNDSGVSHLAAALGVPTVAVFGPTDPAVWAPLGPEVSVVAPCGDEPWPMADDVLIAARRLFGDGTPGVGA